MLPHRYAGSTGDGPVGADELEAQVCGLPGRGGVSHQLLHAVPCAAQAGRAVGAEGGAAGEPEARHPQNGLGSEVWCNAHSRLL